MAIAEVVKHPEAPQTPNPYFVVRNPGTQTVLPAFHAIFTVGLSS